VLKTSFHREKLTKNTNKTILQQPSRMQCVLRLSTLRSTQLLAIVTQQRITAVLLQTK